MRADVAVVGSGITGLSTALHVAQSGAAVVLLEAEEIGFGASGRNGGQVNPGLKPDPDTVERDFGADLGGTASLAMRGEMAPCVRPCARGTQRRYARLARSSGGGERPSNCSRAMPSRAPRARTAIRAPCSIDAAAT
jgi:glycine/D-amino acid oxidase-like deaminating enzyme